MKMPFNKLNSKQGILNTMKTLKYIIPVFALFLAACSGGKLDRSTVPAAGPAPEISIGDYQSFQLENGLQVIVVKNDKLPRVSYQLTIDRDPIFEGDHAGYVSMAGALLSAGTTKRSKAEIDETIDFIGASLNTYATGMSGACLTKHSDELLSLMQEVLLSPSFPEEEIEKMRKQTLSGLASAKTSANDISGNISNAMCYGLDHPYGEQQTEKTTEAITREDLVNYYTQYFRPNISYLVIVGDIEADEARAQADKYFGSWEAGDVPMAPAFSQPTAPEGNRVAFVPLKGAVQSVIEITHPIAMPPGHPDAIAASVMNNILGGGVFGGRLMQNLREDKGFTYGARSSFSPDEVVGSFSAFASVRNEVTDSSVVEFLYEIDLLTREKVADTTLQFIKNYMNGSFARSLESPQTIARFALNIERYGLPKDYYSTYLTKLAAVTPDDILTVAQKYLRPENLYITVVGNKDEVADKLAQFASTGEVEFYDIYGNEYSDLEAAPEGITAQQVFEAHYAAMGGIEKLSNVNSVIEIGTMAMGPMALDYQKKTQGNDKMMMSVTMGGQEMMKQIVNGDKGLASQMGMTVEMSSDELEAIKRELDLLLFLHLDRYGMSAELKGIGVVDDQRVYVVEIFNQGELEKTVYFNTESGMMSGEEATQDTPQGQITTTSTVLAYTDVNGIQYPSFIRQAVGPQVIELKLSEVSFNKRISSSEFKIN